MSFDALNALLMCDGPGYWDSGFPARESGSATEWRRKA
jgi:hypothetical protein